MCKERRSETFTRVKGCWRVSRRGLCLGWTSRVWSATKEPTGASFATPHTKHAARDAVWTDAPINGSTFSAVKKCSQFNISITIGVETKNSLNLSSGRRPMSKSDVFFVSTPIVFEIWPPQLFTFSKKVYHLYRSISLGPPPTGPAVS